MSRREGDPPDSGPSFRRLEARDVAEHLSSQALSQADAWLALENWLTERADFLPLLGFDRSLLSRIAQMEPVARRRYLRWSLPQTLLEELDDPAQYRAWQQLSARYREAARGLIQFWRQRRNLGDAED
jgi:hypothetical protein